MIKKDQDILLINKERKYLVKCSGKFSTKYGTVDLDKLIGKKLGSKAKMGSESYIAIEPTIVDFLEKGTKRGPQAILPKDASIILAITGLDSNSIVVDSGTGSAFLSIFLGSHAKKVYTYERNEDFAKRASENIKRSGLKNIKITNADFSKCKEKNVDIVTLDMQEPNIKKARLILKPGGWIAVFCLHMEQVQNVCTQLEPGFTQPTIVENIYRPWQCQIGDKTYTRPKTQMLGHTGILVFARKI